MRAVAITLVVSCMLAGCSEKKSASSGGPSGSPGPSPTTPPAADSSAGVPIRPAPGPAGPVDSARITLTKASMKQIEMGLQAYRVDNGSFPEHGLRALVEEPSDQVSGRWNGPYLSQLVKDAWGREFKYRFPGENNTDSYDLWSAGPDGQLDTSDDISNWTK